MITQFNSKVLDNTITVKLLPLPRNAITLVLLRLLTTVHYCTVYILYYPTFISAIKQKTWTKNELIHRGIKNGSVRLGHQATQNLSFHIITRTVKTEMIVVIVREIETVATVTSITIITTTNDDVQCISTLKCWSI